MPTTRIAVNVDKDRSSESDRLVAIKGTVQDKPSWPKQRRLTAECAKLKSREEKQCAESDMDILLEAWSDY